MTRDQFIYGLTACGCLLKDGKTWYEHDELIKCFEDLGLFEQEPRCKDCKWWKDSDGKYRRGCRAESHCPINRREVYEGNGYCYMFLPKADMKEVEE